MIIYILIKFSGETFLKDKNSFYYCFLLSFVVKRDVIADFC